MATLHTELWEMSTFISRNVAQGTPQKNLCSQQSLGGQTAEGVWQKMRSNQLQDKQDLWYHSGATRLPATALKRWFPKGQSKPFPPVFYGVNDQPGFWEWQTNSSAAEVTSLGHKKIWDTIFSEKWSVLLHVSFPLASELHFSSKFALTVLSTFWTPYCFHYFVILSWRSKCRQYNSHI